MVKKVLFILIVAALLFVCCGTGNSNREHIHIEKSSAVWKVFEGDLEKTTVRDTVGGGYGTFYVAEISGCEYVVGTNCITHKGNCKPCAERKKKETSSSFLTEDNDLW